MKKVNSKNESDVLHLLTSIDCVIFGFHDGILKILLNKYTTFNKWMLPGDFIKKNESIDDAALHILEAKTGLTNIYLHQFYTFGALNRTGWEENENALPTQQSPEAAMDKPWLQPRFISIGYYALVNYSQVNIHKPEGIDIKWFRMDEIPFLYADHNLIIEKAMCSIRTQLQNIPVGYKLLPERFTLSELRIIYETILGKKLDRRNFQRKMLSSGLVERLDVIQKRMGFKPTTLFSFSKEKYRKAIENGERLF